MSYDEVMRCRLSEETLARMDRVVAYARGRGARHVSRSFLLRDALDEYLDKVEKEFDLPCPA